MIPMIYVAHAIRDPRGPYWMEQKIRVAEQVAIELWKLGAAVITPGLNTKFFDGAAPDDVWLQGDLVFVERSDAVVLAPNWKNSVGANGEKRHAESKNVPVFEWETQFSEIHKFIESFKAKS